jgi:predicted NUDIX family NTP pyrophosphohydrolase
MLADRCQSDEELEQLDISLGQVTNPEEEALAALKAHQEETGMTFENPDEPVQPFGTQNPEALWP